MNTTLWNAGLFGGGALIADRPVSARDLIYRALRELQVIKSGQRAGADAINDGFESLNDLVDSWNTERLSIPAIARDVFELTHGEMVYQLGDGVSVRPQKVEAAGLLREGDTTERRLNILQEDPRHTGNRGVYVDGAYPSCALVISPAPSTGDQLAIYSWATMLRFENLDIPYGFPPGYLLALRFDLANVMAPQFAGSQKSPALLGDIARKAVEYKSRLKTLNSRAPEMESDPILLGYSSRTFDVRTGRYR